MRNWLKFYLQWHPPIMHDLHESQPLLYTFSGQSPQNPTLDPILYAELPLVLQFRDDQDDLATACRACGRTRSSTCGRPAISGFMSSNHNGMLRMYETFGNGGANTMPAHHRRRRSRRQSRGAKPAGGGRGGRGGGHDRARMVPAAASAARARLVHAQQHELHGDRRPLGARTHRRASPRPCSRTST